MVGRGCKAEGLCRRAFLFPRDRGMDQVRAGAQSETDGGQGLASLQGKA